jgi:hypothetical protein
MEGWSECGGWGMMLLPFGREMQAASRAGPERAECGGNGIRLVDWRRKCSHVITSNITVQY